MNASNDPTIVDWLTLFAAVVGAVTTAWLAIWSTRFARRTTVEEGRRQAGREALVVLMAAAEQLDIAATRAAFTDADPQGDVADRREQFFAVYRGYGEAVGRVQAIAPSAVRDAAGHLANLAIQLVQSDRATPGNPFREFSSGRERLNAAIRAELGSD